MRLRRQCRRSSSRRARVQVLCIVANQISRKLVKGYIALPQRVLVVQKGHIDKAFPKLTDASWA